MEQDIGNQSQEVSREPTKKKMNRQEKTYKQCSYPYDQRPPIEKLLIFGLATDYCVKATAIDAADAGFKVTVIEGLSKGVAPDTTDKALEEMKSKGIIIKTDVDM